MPRGYDILKAFRAPSHADFRVELIRKRCTTRDDRSATAMNDETQFARSFVKHRSAEENCRRRCEFAYSKYVTYAYAAGSNALLFPRRARVIPVCAPPTRFPRVRVGRDAFKLHAREGRKTAPFAAAGLPPAPAPAPPPSPLTRPVILTLLYLL